MQPGRVKAAADERRVGDGVELTENADGVHDDEVGVRSGAPRHESREARHAEAVGRRPRLDGREVRRRRLVRREHQPRSRILPANHRPPLAERGLVGRPRASRNDREAGPPRRGQRGERRQLERRGEGTPPHLIVARVAGDAHAIGAHAEGDQPLGIRLVDRAHGVERRVRVAEQGRGETAPARRSRR
jgi:hypothetical protein